MARAAQLSEQELPRDHNHAGKDAARPANKTPAAKKQPRELWTDSLGRVATRSAQILLILVVAGVSVYALLQIRLLVIPTMIALILAAAIGPDRQRVV